MAGILVNGCGASDSYYKIKDLGMAYCSTCRKMRPFALMELKMKIRVFWIPTVPISKKYAVTCTSCKNGYYVDEQQMNDIVNGRVKAEIASDGVTLRRVGEQKDSRTVREIGKQTDAKETIETDTVKADPIQVNPIQVNPVDIEQINVETERVQFSDVAPEIRDIEPVPVPSPTIDKVPIIDRTPIIDKAPSVGFRMPRRKICPVCNLLYMENKEICDICGRKLVDRQ